jgi:hypothetical protein
VEIKAIKREDGCALCAHRRFDRKTCTEKRLHLNNKGET